LEDCQQDGLTPDETYWLLELHARTVLGAQIAWYLDRMINPDEREEIKQKLLSAAEAISSLRKGRATEPGHESRSYPLREHDHADGVSGSVYERVEQTLAEEAQ